QNATVRQTAKRAPGSHQARLPHRGGDEAGEQRMRLERAALELGVELHADEPRVIGTLDDLREQSVGRHAREYQPALLERLAVGRIDLVAMPVTLGNDGGAPVNR